MSDILSDLQSAIVARLTDDATDLDHIDIVNAADTDAMRQIEAAMAGDGVVAIVVSPDFAWDDVDEVTAECQVRVLEKWMQNRSKGGTNIAGSAHAMHIAAWIMNADLAEIWSPLQLDTVSEMEATEEIFEWAVTFHTRAQTSSEMEVTT